MVPTIVIAGVLIGMIAIVPSAVADQKKHDDDDDDDEEKCTKWFYLAFKEFSKKGWIPQGIEKKVLDCYDDGHESPWDLPNLNPHEDEQDDPLPPVLSGLIVELVVSDMKIPVSNIHVENAHNPCPSGKIIIDSPEWTVLDVAAEVFVNMENDRTTLMVTTKNLNNIEGMLLFTTPCLGLVEN